jgi:TonB-dependent SusC/RagA subfamily outer membrane receptor
MRYILLILFINFIMPVNFAQEPVSKDRNIIISGRVTDMNNVPVNGAAILIDDKDTRRSTDRKGYYRVKTGSDSKIISILISSDNLGKTKINGQTEIDISLPVNSLTISHHSEAEEDEINVGYGTVKRKNLLSSVNKIDGNEKRYSSYSSIYEMLQGQPGVQVSGTRVVIQGQSSFIGSTDPLFVVDGSIVNTIEGISPQTVKSIEILKGAAASIYGSRGANGVILITLISGPDKF